MESATGRHIDALTVIGLSRAIERAVNTTGLTSTQYRALSLIDAGVTSSGVIANFMAVRPPTVTTVMNGLVENDWAHRHRPETDRRRIDYGLTAEGARVLASAQAAVDDTLAALVADLPAGDQAAAWAGLGVWRQALYRSPAPSPR